MRANEIMTPDPMTLEMSARVSDALQVLQTLEIRHLPIVDERGRLVGMLSDRDIRSNAQLEQQITQVMSSDVVTVGAESEMLEVIDVLLEQRVGAVPVIDESSGDLLGIVSYVDVLRAVRAGM
jgi:acetoin utilization protein AcuB